MQETPMEIKLVLDAKAQIGESPTWVASENALYWIDVKAPCLHKLDLSSLQSRRWNFASDVGAFALQKADASDAVVALRDGLHALDMATGRLRLLAPPPFDPTLFRFNEGACDAAGSFWIGIMFDPQDGKNHTPKPASLYSYTLAEGLRPEPEAAELHNGMAWSPDGTRFYLSHSYDHTIYAFGFDSNTGRLIGKTRFAELPADGGLPDGAAVDVEGGYWCAVHGGGRLQRYTQSGELDYEVMLPVSQPTMCAFAGAALDIMYVTSARDGLSAAELSDEPLAGGLFRFKPGVCGIKRRCFVV